MGKPSDKKSDNKKKVVFLFSIILCLFLIPFAVFSSRNEELASSPPIIPMPQGHGAAGTDLDPNEDPSAEALSSCLELSGDACLSQSECEGSLDEGGLGGSCIAGSAATCDGNGCCCDLPDEGDVCPAGTALCSLGCPDVACFNIPSDPDGDGCCECIASLICGDSERCGDEECDDGNLEIGDGCDDSCLLESPEDCGNDELDAGEECDDGNQTAGDGCNASCQIEECGDGNLDVGEACDDGNATSGDGCDSVCEFECGNDVIDSGEQCDDGNTASGDGCSDTCQFETSCGNSVQDPGEQCDDGNFADGDGCDQNCVSEVCGNSITQWGETCDDGNTTANDGCDADCQTEDECPAGSTCESTCPVNLNTGTACGIGEVCCLASNDLCVSNGVDGIDDIMIQGGITVTQDGFDTTFEDACTTDQSSVIEAECLGVEPDFHTILCPTGFVCLSGACQELVTVGTCGDGDLDANESCDDGCLKGVMNVCEPIIDDGDGCSHRCLIEILIEEENCSDSDGQDLFSQGKIDVTRSIVDGSGQTVSEEEVIIQGFCGNSNTDCCLDEGGEFVFEFVCTNPFLFRLKCPVNAPVCFNGACTDQAVCPGGLNTCTTPGLVSGNNICLAQGGSAIGCSFPIDPCDSTCETRFGGEFCQECSTCSVQGASCVCACGDLPCDTPGDTASCQALPTSGTWS